ncbi:ankyrin repeat and fibronectin type-III domain-containing protein 1-like [Osmerus mordax]|uniref:ankyrin repeat and fibronectin type-III domain-containing protein 1-like n=1 Tax=Osmerus mordax TaxID=8014 RepID=UPI00350FD463
MSVSVPTPLQRRRSLGAASPKRLYRNLSVRLWGGDASVSGETHTPGHPCRATPTYKSLWEAVEYEDTLAVQTLLSRDRASSTGGGGGGGGGGVWDRGEKKEKDWERERERGVNRVNEQGLVPLDVAALTQNSPLLHVLTRAGARHNPVLCRPADWMRKLDALVLLASRQAEEKKNELAAKAGVGPQVQVDAQKQHHLWTLRQQLYCRMRRSFQLTELPAPPSSVSLLVTSSSSLYVAIKEPVGMTTGLITRYRVEWSSSSSFRRISGSAQITDTKSPAYNITGLRAGVHCYVRVMAYNVKGWGPPQTSSPLSAAPSSWRECVGVKANCMNQEAVVRKILEQTREPHYRGYCIEGSRFSCPSKRLSVSRSLKQLFQSATKFVRLLQRGVYLATVFYHKENVLVTADDQLPLVEIQCCSTSITQDFLWFAKLSCAWQQVPWLQQALSSALSSSSSLLQNRHNILRAVTQLQSSLGTSDLGQVYYEPLKDRQGNVVLVTVRECAAPTGTPEPPLHWVPLDRLEKNRCRTPLLPEPSAMDTLTEQLKEKLSYHRRSGQRAQPGLYVGILKLCSSVEQIRVLVPQRFPNLLCHTRIRHNSHVSREEWAWLQSHVLSTANGSVLGGPGGGDEGLIDSCVLGDFVKHLRTAVTLLLTKLNIPLYRAYQYGVYTRELLQMGEQMSMILLLPPSEDFSSNYWPLVGTKEPGFTLPLQIFELVHFWTYKRDFLSYYCQAWVRLDLDTHLSQQALREAMDPKEVQEAKERLNHITQLAQGLDVVWRGSRWIMDVLQCVRSRKWVGAVPLGLVMGGDPPPRPDTAEEEEKSLTCRQWPFHPHPQKTPAESVCAATVDITSLPAPPALLVAPDNPVSQLGGMAKGGYPVDINAQSRLDYSTAVEPGLELADDFVTPVIDVAAAVGQSEESSALPESYCGEMGCPHVFVAEPVQVLADIFPTLSLIEEETVLETGAGELLGNRQGKEEEQEPEPWVEEEQGTGPEPWVEEEQGTGPWPGDSIPGDSIPGDSSPGDSIPGDSSPGDSIPGDSSPGDSIPGDSSPGDSSPGDSSPGDSSPGDSIPGDSSPGDSSPGDSSPGDSSPGDSIPGDSSPGDSSPGDSIPGDSIPGDSSPGDSSPGDSSPGDSSPGDSSPGDSSPGDSSPGDSSPGDSSPGDSSPGDSIPGDSIPGDSSPGDSIPGDSSPGDSSPGDSSPGDSSPGDSSPGDSIPGDSSPGDSSPGDSIPGDSSPGDSSPGDSIPGDEQSAESPSIPFPLRQHLEHSL